MTIWEKIKNLFRRPKYEEKPMCGYCNACDELERNKDALERRYCADTFAFIKREIREKGCCLISEDIMETSPYGFKKIDLAETLIDAYGGGRYEWERIVTPFTIYDTRHMHRVSIFTRKGELQKYKKQLEEEYIKIQQEYPCVRIFFGDKTKRVRKGYKGDKCNRH